MKSLDGKYLVSAIISIYNCEEFLAGCLEDLEQQSIADRIEIIAVNSGSQQNEEAIINEFQKRYDNIVYIKTEQRETIYKAWNRGIQASSGKYITNANSDDRRRKDAFEVMAKFLDDHDDIGLVYPSYRITHSPNESFENSKTTEYYDAPAYDRYSLLFQCLPGPFPMWRKAVHNSYGYFNESLKVAGDHEFWLQISESGQFFHINEYLGLYYRNPQGGELRDPVRARIEAVDVINNYIDDVFLEKYTEHIEIKETVRKRQSDLSFWAADFFFFKHRVDLTKKYVRKSLSYGNNHFRNYKLLLYCILPRSLVRLIRSVKHGNYVRSITENQC